MPSPKNPNTTGANVVVANVTSIIFTSFQCGSSDNLISQDMHGHQSRLIAGSCPHRQHVFVPPVSTHPGIPASWKSQNRCEFHPPPVPSSPGPIELRDRVEAPGGTIDVTSPPATAR